MKQEKKKSGLWKSFLHFYTLFPIPWWLFLLSIIFSLLYAELAVQVAAFTVKLNTGELYNSVILGYASLTLLMALVSIAVNMTTAYGKERITLRTRSVLWRKILHLPVKTIDEEQPSALISRITADAAEASSTISYLCNFVSSIYGFTRMYIVLFQYSRTMTLWLLLAIPAAVLEFWLIGRSQFISQKKIFASINTMTTFFSEHLAAVKHFKAQSMEEEERKAGFDAIEARFRADVFQAFVVAFQVTVNSIYTKLCMIILVFTGRREILAGRMDSNGLNVTDTYLGNVQQYLAEILTQYETVKGVQGVLEKAARLMEEDEEPAAAGDAASLPESSADLVLDHVSFSYREGEEVLHDVSLVIPGGKRTALVGDNGCGKSTLLKLLLRFYPPDSGAITYGGTPAEDFGLDEWRRSFGCVLQSAPLFAGTIRDNITYGVKRDVSEEELRRAAELADAWSFIQSFPEGFDKEVGEGGMYLSGGQRQRVAIARTILTNPDILLMDEATASLDRQSDRIVWAGTEQLMRGRTTLLIAHDMETIRSADYIIVMKDGRVEAAGTDAQMMACSPTYRAYARLQSREAVTV